MLQGVLSKKRTGEQLKGSKIAKKASTGKFVIEKDAVSLLEEIHKKVHTESFDGENLMEFEEDDMT